MPKYLTPNQYQQYSDYLLTSDITPLILARTIKRAEEDIDAFMKFDLLLGGFEPHTAWIQFPWNGQSRKVRVPNFPVTIRRALRYVIQVSTQSDSGAPFVAIINTGDVAYNVFEFYIEIVPLQSITYALTPVLVQLGLDPPIVQLDYEAGFFLPVWGEILFDGGNQQTYYAEHGFWAMTYTQALSIQPQTLPAIPPVVYVNGGVANPSTYTVNVTEGTITFSVARQSSDVVTADYSYTIPDLVTGACIDQTTFLLGQRALNRSGMSGLDMVRSGEQQAKRTDTSESGLCKRAMDKLSGYDLIGIA